MKLFGLFVAVISFSMAASASSTFDCTKVSTQVYSSPIDGATVDPLDGLFISYIQDTGGGFEVTDAQISSFSSLPFDRKSECTVTKQRSGATYLLGFTCQSLKSALQLSATLSFDGTTRTGVYEGTIVGGPVKAFKFTFSGCTLQ